MASIVKMLRAAADPTRLRILLLLKAEELSVAELQEILVMGQSTISTHLSQLKQAGLVEDRRTGKSSFYRLSTVPVEELGDLVGHDFSRAGTNAEVVGHDFSRAANDTQHDGPLGPEGSSPLRRRQSFLDELLAQAERETPEAQSDLVAMRRVVKKRQDKMRSFFDAMAGRLGRDYVPGKSWKSLAEALLRLMPPMVVADLGAGDGSSALLLSQSARQVIAVDTSERMLEVARDQAARLGIRNIEFREGDMEELPIDAASIDVAFFSQSLHHALHPQKALAEAARILRPGGRVIVLDLAKHRFEEARELYADEWLGFSEAEMDAMLTSAGFANVSVSIVDRSTEAPQFQTLLAVGEKSST